MTGHLPRTLARDAPRSAGTRFRLCGWACEVCDGDGTRRLVLRDHTGAVELVGLDDHLAQTLVPASALDVTGALEPGPDGSPRLRVDSVEVAGPAAGALPIGDGAGLDERLDWRFIDLRSPRNRLVLEVQTTAERAMRDLWRAQGFIEIHSPRLRPLPNKSGGELFAVEYFGGRVYLAQSPQWYKQMAMAAGLDRVFDVGPVFRPQREPTSRHATEFTSVDVELSWIDSDDDVMAHAEELLCAAVAAVYEEHGDAVARWFGVELTVPSRPFPRVTFDQAAAIVAAAGSPLADDAEDLDPEGERLLAARVAREAGHDLVFVTDYPEPSRPYYHMRRGETTVATRSFDLLWRGLEIASGAQREHRHDRLVAQARARGVAVDRVRQYLDFFKYGCPPHGGFGLGLTRLLMSMLGIADVREATFLFRGPDRVTP
ncbi:MAG TPA: aspartate--tRNA(Asn) ligase [Candidatus Dormibacteraeota bacterium]|nr:aspartate--tRNA(Asn) ligase [Candidatus Dormibacteraeota bacterium]